MKNLHPRIKHIGLLTAACFVLSPQARAACEEGCDPVNFNTFFGEDALLDHSGVSNTAIGVSALVSNTTGIDNTAIGFQTLFSNSTGGANTERGQRD